MELRIFELAGSPARMGEAFGESCAAAMHELYELRLEAALQRAQKAGRRLTREQVLVVCRSCLPATQAYDPVGYEEFAGIARAAGLSPEQGYALQGLTDLRDLLVYGPAADGTGCSSFVIAADRSATGHLLLGQTWDLQTDNLPFVCLVHRRPDQGPETWALTLTGCLTLIGINAEGVAVGNTNLVTTDVRPGVQYLTVLHRALRARSTAEAVACIRAAPRAAAHYYYVAGPDDTAVGLECSAWRAASVGVSSGAFVHCNHALQPEIVAVEAEPPGLSSRHRQERLGHLLAARREAIGVADLQRLLADHEGGPDRCICRHDFDGVSTNAVVILSPATRELHACRGQPHVGQWVTRQAGA